LLSLIGSVALELITRLKAGGIIVNEHTLTLEETRRHVDVLGRWFDFIELRDLAGRLGRRSSKPFCLLTFDDGKCSNATVTAPELERLGVPAVFLVVSEFLGGTIPLWFDRYRLLQRKLGTFPAGLSPNSVKQLPFALLIERIDRACKLHGIDASANDEGVAPMTWDQARQLHKLGFSIGAHGTTHAILTRERRASALRNIANSISTVGLQLGEPCTSFAFPNGNYTAELAQYAVSCGAQFVMTTEPTWADATFHLWRLPRLQLFGSQSRGRIELKIAASATGRILLNPDGTHRTYARLNKLARTRRRKRPDGEPYERNCHPQSI
jgi:peptidoglycan/xylan/chitin deacetylase (PgdA/CDA1 family)